ncbi:MAG: serine protease [Spirochaetaceae bacterium]|nr:serine protease [Spirochaetaceae bacterium]
MSPGAADAIMGCDEGLLEFIAGEDLPSAADGTPAEEDFVTGTLTGHRLRVSVDDGPLSAVLAGRVACAPRLIGAAAAAIVCAASMFAQESTATWVYESVAPAVVFVETDGGSGSGLLLASNAVLTVAHGVYPYRSARIVFPPGTEVLDVPVIGWDLMTDVAVLGPISDATPEPPPMGFPDGLPVGAELFVIGYPHEEEEFPQPAISRTLLSRNRLWPGQQVTYLQTDDALDGGHSGGVLVSAAGEVVGIALYSHGHFGLALSIADALSRASSLLAGEDPAGLGDRGWWRSTGQAIPIRFELATLWSTIRLGKPDATR